MPDKPDLTYGLGLRREPYSWQASKRSDVIQALRNRVVARACDYFGGGDAAAKARVESFAAVAGNHLVMLGRHDQREDGYLGRIASGLKLVLRHPAYEKIWKLTRGQFLQAALVRDKNKPCHRTPACQLNRDAAAQVLTN